MKWSKLKQRIEDTFADSIKNKIKIYNTVYRKSYDACFLSRTWFELDGKELVNFCDINSDIKFKALYHEYTPTHCVTHEAIKPENRTPKNLCEKGEFSSLDFKEMAFIYLNTSAHDCIKSKHPILRVLGTLNKKVGKNKLKEILEDEHPLVSFLANYRLNQEINRKIENDKL